MDERLLSCLSSLPGVIDLAILQREDVTGFLDAEGVNLSAQLIPVRNLGIETVVARENIVIILKDTTFRPPPGPTIYLVEDAEHIGSPPEEFLEISGAAYHIIGEEVMGSDPDYTQEFICIDKGFVLFTERREKSRPVPAFFILPPISFPELEAKKNSLSIEHIVSVSPSSPGDEYLRTKYNLAKSREYATVLIGWDGQGSHGGA